VIVHLFFLSVFSVAKRGMKGSKLVLLPLMFVRDFGVPNRLIVSFFSSRFFNALVITFVVIYIGRDIEVGEA
jgi:hypothetical protein